MLIRHGFEEVVIHTPLIAFLPRRKRIALKGKLKLTPTQSLWERIRQVIEALGPTFIKGAQIMSNRPDLLPENLIEELKKLQSEVPPFPFVEAREILEEELGISPEEVFEWIEETPIGSASIGQVHKARLLDGREVVIKVQRPGVKETVEADLLIIKEIAHRAEAYFRRQGILNPMEIVEEFEKVIHRELRYTYEARNIEQFRNFYRNYTNFYIPAVYRQYSTDRILVMEYIDGCKITDVAQLKAWGHDPQQIAETGMDIYMTQIFKYGYFHADPHPGNVWVRQDGVICLIDFGMVGKLMKRDKYALARIFVGIAQDDATLVARALRKLAIEDGVEEMSTLEYELSEFIHDFVDLEVQQVSFSELVSRLHRIIYHYKMRLPGRIFLILRALTILEGMGRVVYPTFNTFEFIRPYGRRLMQEQFSASNVLNSLLSRLYEMDAFVAEAPTEMRVMLRKINRGKLRLEVENRGLGPIARTLDVASRRLALSLIIAALLLTGGIIITSDAASQHAAWKGIPLLSLFAFVSATLLGVFWLWGLRPRR